MTARKPFLPVLAPRLFRVIRASDSGALKVPRRFVDDYEEIGVIETYDALAEPWSVLGRSGYVRLLGASDGEHHHRPVVFASKVLPYAVRRLAVPLAGDGDPPAAAADRQEPEALPVDNLPGPDEAATPEL